MDAWVLSIDISLYCLGYFIWSFIWMPGCFQQIFYYIALDISLGFSYGCLGAFNRYFILLP